MRTLNELADIVINSVYGGLKAPANISLSKDQVKDEINLCKNRIISDFLKNKIPFDPEELYVRIPISFEEEDMGGGIDTDLDYPTATIPPLMYMSGLKTVRRVSYKDSLKPMKVVFGNVYAFSRYDKYTGKVPTAWINGTILRVLHPPKNLRKADLYAIPSDPRQVYPYNDHDDNHPFPMSADLADRVTGKLINDYLRYYRMQNPQPNTGADINLQNESKR